MLTHQMKNRARATLLAAAASLATLAGAATAHADTDINLVLNWKYQGPQGLLFLAEDNGYFEEEGLNVNMDQGNGSGAAVPLVANGAYDMGFGDINALIELAARNSEEAPVGVFMIYNQPPFTIAVRADSPIESPADLAGKSLGGPANDGALKLFPAFCARSEADCSDIDVSNMQPNLREQMLMQGQVDGVFGYVNTIRFSSKLLGINPDEEIRFIRYGDYGMDLYSNAIIVSKEFAAENPEAVEGFVRAINKSIKDAIADPEAAIESVRQREGLINVEVERERFDATLTDEMSHPELAEVGLGNIDEARMAQAIEILVEANDLPRTPAVSEVFDASFLPERSELLNSVQ
ncbi:ABC transporter substrate-binding protein [uncultured Martelella sp.]|uniref:ABC transporter substrate-binding protein n=1 Tax=uncultured Martelella sp. TaxID=392331 RepID=UPI0029C9203F|nr:ABC transporter substrate-binding protein [uncultured Martelella sp.]